MSIEFLPAFDNNDRFRLPPARPARAAGKACSPRRLAANRRNARRSTGPRTSDGKRRSSRNALKHGLCSSYGVRLAGECGATFNTFIEELRDELRPRGVVQEHLFQQICTLLWRLRRLPEAQAHIFRPELDAAAQGEELSAAEVLARRFSEDPTRNGFLLLDRYERGMRSQFLRLLNQLTRLQRGGGGARDADDCAERVPPTAAWDARKQRELEQWFATPAGRAALQEVQAAVAAAQVAEEAARSAPLETNPIKPTAARPKPRPAKKSPSSAARAGAKRTHSKSPRRRGGGAARV